MKKILIIITMLALGAMLIADNHGMKKMKPMQNDGHCGKHKVERVGGMKGQMGEMMGEQCEMKLTDAQQKEVNTLRHNHRLEMITLRADMEKLRLQVKHNVSEGNFRAAKSDNEKLSAKKADISKKNLELKEKIYNLLDDEQKVDFRKNQAKHCGQRMRKK